MEQGCATWLPVVGDPRLAWEHPTRGPGLRVLKRLVTCLSLPGDLVRVHYRGAQTYRTGPHPPVWMGWFRCSHLPTNGEHPSPGTPLWSPPPSLLSCSEDQGHLGHLPFRAPRMPGHTPTWGSSPSAESFAASLSLGPTPTPGPDCDPEAPPSAHTFPVHYVPGNSGPFPCEILVFAQLWSRLPPPHQHGFSRKISIFLHPAFPARDKLGSQLIQKIALHPLQPLEQFPFS